MSSTPTKGANLSIRVNPNSPSEDVLQVVPAALTPATPDGRSSIMWIGDDGALGINNGGGVNPVVLSSFGGAPTASHGVPVSVFHTDFLNQAAALSGVLLYTVPFNRAGFFRITWLAKVTQTAQNSSVLGGGSAFQITYTDNVDGSVVTTPSTAFTGNSNNTLATQGSGTLNVWAQAGSQILVSFGYTSSGGPAMQYILHARIEDM